MRGPHNIWRLIRTGATLERTGAMNVVLEAFSAPPRLRLVARILGWPFKWLGLKGDPSLPPATRALTAPVAGLKTSCARWALPAAVWPLMKW